MVLLFDPTMKAGHQGAGVGHQAFFQTELDEKRQRLVAAKEAQGATPRTELKAASDLSNPDRWARVNDSLSEKTGNAHELSAEDERTVRRVDRMIQRAERRNDRSHVVYSNVLIPGEIPDARTYAKSFAEGEVIDFDRYTLAAHNIHETEDEIIGHDKLVTFEIATRRGAYATAGANPGWLPQLTRKPLPMPDLPNEIFVPVVLRN